MFPCLHLNECKTVPACVSIAAPFTFFSSFFWDTCESVKRCYGLAQNRVIYCNVRTLYKDREHGEDCSEISIPYKQGKGSVFCSQSDASPGQHCCGTEVYYPHKEICCDGQRHDKKGNAHCCGGEAYDIKDPQMKCCAGKLHNLTLLGRPGHDAQCCGSILQSSQDVCCSSEDKEVLYAAKTGFLCCSHLYYNTSLWSCCAGMLSPVHKAGQHQNVTIKESRLLSLNDLSESSLCNAMQIGTMESVSPCSIVFSNVLKIHGRKASVKHLDSLHILQTPDHCSIPKLIPGNSYFFNGDKVFTDYNHNSVLQSLFFIFSKCYSP